MIVSRNPPLAEVQRLLAGAHLPAQDLGPGHMEHFFAAREDGVLLGVVGVEPRRPVALLRSLAVVESLRNTGLGSRLLAQAEHYAVEQGIRSLYLLTTTASAFFAKRGYAPIAREAVPEAIRGTAEFALLCPATSAIMVKQLDSGLRRRAADEADIVTRTATPADAMAVSALVHASFELFVGPDWTPRARSVFIDESSSARMAEALAAPAHAAASFQLGEAVGFILLRQPSALDMLFVHPRAVRRGIGSALWRRARAFLQTAFPDVTTVELNATRYSLPFYRAMGFVAISAEFERGGCRATRMACRLPAPAPGA